MVLNFGLFFWGDSDEWSASGLCSPFCQIVGSNLGQWCEMDLWRKVNKFSFATARSGKLKKEKRISDGATGIVLMGRPDERATTWIRNQTFSEQETGFSSDTKSLILVVGRSVKVSTT